ncbi:hypothetical protein LSAT2_003628 [Lamellibrachia satsuma]|nr:hypothetical protein LSAT2_003628 [Lamellibrachia satsuma]
MITAQQNCGQRAGQGLSTMFCWTLLLPVVTLLGLTAGLDLENCQDALGMQTREIPDEAITASSSFDLELGPASAR